jgi:hypothetical protein
MNQAIRLARIVADIELGMNCEVRVGHEKAYDLDGNDIGRYFIQIACYRRDVITGEMGYGRGGKYYLSKFQTESEIVQTIFGAYKAYWEHEARENFKWRGRRVFGPHIATEALWEVATRVDVRSAQHVEDNNDER